MPLMAGNTSDEFLNHIEAKDGEQLLKKAEELFKDKADQFLSFEENKKQTPEGFSPVSGIEYSVKRAFLSRKATGCNQNSYYYRFDADIPGWDNAGTFHSCDLWFFFETLAKCWRPFDGLTMIWRVRSAVILSTLLKLAIQTEMIIMKISFQSGSHTAMQTAMK